MSLGAIVFVGAVAWGATGAFFSDTETSTGNTFTAGSIDLTVDSTQHYNGRTCTLITASASSSYLWTGPGTFPTGPCDGTWTPSNLGAQKFFNFSDIKPGDDGEDTISLHVGTNDAYACVDVTIPTNADNGINEPEAAAGDVTDGSTGGELAQNLNFFAWADTGATPGFQGSQVDPTEGDNIWQANELPLFSNIIGPASDALNGKSYTLANSVTGPLVASTTNYIGLAWCAGTMTAVAGVITCDGAGMGNITQTDSMTADIAFRVVQARNNPNFTCVPPVVAPETATVTLDKVVTFTNLAIAGVDVSDYTLHLVGPGGDHVLVDQVPFPGLTPGVYTVSEVYSGNPANVTSSAVFSGSCTEIGTTDTATMTVVAGVNPTCTITNSVTQNPT
jgi:predicted ribosomally synthesized peptide with SipW-like signal peptide